MRWAPRGIRRLLSRGEEPVDPAHFWKRRAGQLGARAVLHIGHGPDRFDAVTEMQRRELFPRLRAELDGSERLILDYGCGPARFTADLAELIGGRAVGVDICRELLAFATRLPSVGYARIGSGRLPLASGCIDVAWVCLVLGGILEAGELARTASEIERVLSPRGLLFLIENTSPRPSPRHWRFRTVEAYRELFPSRSLRHLGDYEDQGERISILAGRRER